jgi:hypothetical protein
MSNPTANKTRYESSELEHIASMLQAIIAVSVSSDTRLTLDGVLAVHWDGRKIGELKNHGVGWGYYPAADQQVCDCIACE